METYTLIVHSDPGEREALKRVLSKAISTQWIEEGDFASALALVGRTTGRINYVIAPWELSEERRQFAQKVKALAQAREALFFFAASLDDAEWLRATLRAVDTFSEAWGDPGRVANFLHQVQTYLNPPHANRARVMIVDDDSEVRQILRDYLGRFGFAEISEAGTGSQALAMLEQEPGGFSLVLSDWRMPEMTGIELLKRVRAVPELSRVGFVMVTSKTPIEQIKTLQAVDFGVNGYILKPFTMKSFQSQLDGVLNDIAKQRSAEAFLVAGRTLLAHGSPFGAETVFKEAMVAFPDHPLLLEGVGDTLAERSSDPKALSAAAEVYEKALGKHPYHLGLFIKCFEVYTAMGRMNDAVRLLKQHQPRAKGDDAFRTRIGKIYLQNGYPDLALVEFDQAIAHNPDNTEAKQLQKRVGSGPDPKLKKAS